MNFTGTGADNTSNRRQHHPQHGGEGGNSFEEEDEEERRNMGPTGQLFPSSSSSSPSSHQYKNNPRQHQQPSLFHPQPPYLQPPRGGWMHGGGESSSRVADPMMVDYSSSAPVTPTDNNNDNNTNNDQQGMMMVEREHMFDKVVTPSDVGKLNRLVIPKQHAERYFPLDSSTNDKGLLLNFEDRNGKPWRFRYSYWNSSQSYVMTKGWSRFVKDKKLDAGDIVSFQRGVGGSAKDRLFIDWRHRPDAPVAPPYQLSSSNLSFPLSHHQFSLNRNNINPWNPLFLQSQPAQSRSHSNLMLQPSSYRYGNTGGPYHTIGTGSVVNVNQGGSGSVIYFRSGRGSDMNMIPLHQRSIGGTGTGIGMDIPIPIPPVAAPPAPQSELVFDSVPVVHGKAAAKRLRLFGVNMDCPISDDDEQDYDPPSEMVISSTTAANSIPMGNYHHDHQPPTSSSTIPYLQLRPYEDEESQFHETAMTSSSSNEAFNKTTKSPSSRMSLDLDI